MDGTIVAHRSMLTYLLIVAVAYAAQFLLTWFILYVVSVDGSPPAWRDVVDARGGRGVGWGHVVWDSLWWVLPLILATVVVQMR